VLKKSVLLTTGFAVAIVVSIPLLGGAGVAVGAADQPAGTIVISASTPRSILASPAKSKESIAATTDASSTADSTGPSKSTADSAVAVPDAAAKSPAATTQATAPAQPAVHSNASTQAISRGVSSSSNGESTARVTAAAPHVVAHQAAKPAVTPAPPKAAATTKSCPSAIGGSPSTVPGNIVSGEGLQGTTNQDLASFALQYNATRVANCLPPIELSHIRYNSCLQARMFWIAEDPSTNPASAWGHGVPRSDGKPIVGCDGDIAGGMGDTGATAADKWWESPDHRASLYQPQWGDESYANVCIGFAISHGGIPNDPAAFSRESAVWETC
jgi:hypothetical protein